MYNASGQNYNVKRSSSGSGTNLQNVPQEQSVSQQASQNVRHNVLQNLSQSSQQMLQMMQNDPTVPRVPTVTYDPNNKEDPVRKDDVRNIYETPKMPNLPIEPSVPSIPNPSKVQDNIPNMPDVTGNRKTYDDDSDSDSDTHERIVHRNVRTTEKDPLSCIEKIVQLLSMVLYVLLFPIAICFSIRILQEYERAVVLRMGRLRPGGPKGPGMIFLIPCIDEMEKVDLRTRSLDVPPQAILTKDSVTVNVEAVVYYRVSNAQDVLMQVIDPQLCCRLLAMTTLRNVTGMYMLIELISAKKTLSRRIKSMLDSTGAIDSWGIRIERVEIKDILMPESLQRAMAVEQEARREAMAKVAAANGERDAVVTLKEAADVMESNPIALQLRYLQTLNTICNNQTEAIVFPLPIDILGKVFK